LKPIVDAKSQRENETHCRNAKPRKMKIEFRLFDEFVQTLTREQGRIVVVRVDTQIEERDKIQPKVIITAKHPAESDIYYYELSLGEFTPGHYASCSVVIRQELEEQRKSFFRRLKEAGFTVRKGIYTNNK